ncbi:NRDE-2, necessary for RNA interference-domain-containing protein [Pyrenochaeta sp. MPI-SDFR-AT-0127]|nr:NRDE-2, necessary for RNA interference-domain-containing protein [Pyrenochaeta sp. MPI-SDFR-AT-0127]
MAANIPKFASFRPKPKQTLDPPKESSSAIERTDTLPKEKARSKQRRPASPPTQGPAREQQVPSNKPYFSDRRGDAEILRYGTLNRYEIPAYRRVGNGCVLGLSSDQKIDRENSTAKAIYITPANRRRQERLLTNKHLHKSSGRALRLVKVDDLPTNLNEDFIALSKAGKRKHDDSEEEYQGTPELDYRGIDGNSKPSEPADPDTQFESDTELSSVHVPVIRKNSELVRRTREDSEDLEGWLDLIDHQEAMLKLERPAAELTVSDKAHLANVRTAMFEEALKKIGNNKHSQIKLYEGLMKEAAGTWHEAKLAAKWKAVLVEHPHSVDLWLMYLEFVQSNFAGFKYEHCRSIFFECFDALSTGPIGIELETTLHILLRLTSMIQEAGYQELALAIWQALLEFHLLRPATDAETKSEEARRAFEEFWETEVPRIGEPDAKGWKRCSVDDVPPPGPPPLQETDSSEPVLESFRKREMEAVLKLRLPGRTSDAVGDDDAFHTIFFSDLEDYLKIIPARTPNILIFEAFLCFCRLPPLARTIARKPKWWSDPILQRISYSALRSKEEASQYLHALEKFSDSPIKELQMTSDLLFDQGFSLNAVRLAPDFVRRLLLLLATEASSEDIIGEYLLAFELSHFPARVHKTAKQLLNARPSSLRLYNAYGLVESRRGNMAKADQVFSIALSMQKEDVMLAVPEGLELYSSWVWEALRRAEPTEAFWRLVSPHGKIQERATQDMQPKHDVVLRARTILSETIERALLGQDYQSAVLSTSLLALLTYLSSNGKAELAIIAYQNLSAWFTSQKLADSPHAELHAQAIARFLTYHIAHAPIVQPAFVRKVLESVLIQFPNNTILLSLYAANEARFSIDDRVRGIMRKTTLHGSSPINMSGWAFAIHYETIRGEVAGSTSHSIRALYKRATDATGAHSPALWEAYLQFEIGQLQQEQMKWMNKKARKDGKKAKWEVRVDEAQQRVKETFHSGLQKLPWCKDFVMLAFTKASHVFDDQETCRLYRIMQEKELRLYVELDETDLEMRT